MVHGPEEISQVRIDNPLVPLVELSPYLAQCSVGGPPPPVPVVGIIEYRLEDRLQPILQRLLAHPIVNRRYTEWAKLPRLSRLRD